MWKVIMLLYSCCQSLPFIRCRRTFVHLPSPALHLGVSGRGAGLAGEQVSRVTTVLIGTQVSSSAPGCLDNTLANGPSSSNCKTHRRAHQPMCIFQHLSDSQMSNVLIVCTDKEAWTAPFWIKSKTTKIVGFEFNCLFLLVNVWIQAEPGWNFPAVICQQPNIACDSC